MVDEEKEGGGWPGQGAGLGKFQEVCVTVGWGWGMVQVSARGPGMCVGGGVGGNDMTGMQQQGGHKLWSLIILLPPPDRCRCRRRVAVSSDQEGLGWGMVQVSERGPDMCVCVGGGG